MQQHITRLLALLLSTALSAQTTADFENFNLPPNTFVFDAAPNSVFESGHISLPNNYNAAWMSWNGWAISNRRDTLTPGFLNESSAIAGGGANGSATYAVSYVFGASVLRLTGPAAGGTVAGLYVTNNTYTYYSMKDGDAFAKKFGGITGNDPDFFLLTVKKFRNGQLGPDSVNFYLADYRFANNAQDYIVKNWTYVDLSGLGATDSLQCTLSSSDVGAFGMNTPAYFCVDDVTTSPVLSQHEARTNLQFEMFPNPATEWVTVRLPEAEAVSPIELFDQHGRLVRTAQQQQMDVQGLAPGLYWVRVRHRDQVGSRKLMIGRSDE